MSKVKERQEELIFEEFEEEAHKKSKIKQHMPVYPETAVE